MKNCWTIEEAQATLTAAKTFGPQVAALMALALDSGMRKGELIGLKWTDVNLDAGKLTVFRQLLSCDGARRAGVRCPEVGTVGHDRSRARDRHHAA